MSNDSAPGAFDRQGPGNALGMSRSTKAIGGSLAVILVIALGYVLLGPARGAREDINDQKHLIAAQLVTVRAQLELQRQQLEVARRQLAVAEQTRDIAKDTLARAAALETIAAQTRDIARSTDAKAGQLSELSRQLLALARLIEQIARDTDRHAANIDRKTVPLP